MYIVRWLDDLTEYRLRLQQFSDEELEDVYFHMDLLRYPEHYHSVLMEFRRRQLEPTIADRPFPETQWTLPHLLAYCPFLTRSKVLFQGGLAFSFVALSFLLTSASLFPFWLLMGPLGVLNAASALINLILMPIALMFAGAAMIRAGARGVYLTFALAGVALGIILFLNTGLLETMIQEMSRTHPPVSFMDYPRGIGF